MVARWLASEPMVNHDDGSGHVPLVLHVEPAQKAAFARWAAAEQRSLSAQARVVLAEIIPGKFVEDEGAGQP